MTRKKWSFLFTVCLMTALIGCGQKNSQVDKNNSEELNKLGQISGDFQRRRLRDKRYICFACRI